MPAAYLYLHGLQSSPQAQKACEIAEFLKTRGQTLLCPDLRAPYGMVHGLQHAFEIAVAAMDAEEAHRFFSQQNR